jgi:hypothetical protein
MDDEGKITYDVWMSACARYKLDPRQIEACPVSRNKDGIVIYHRRITKVDKEQRGGVQRIWGHRPIRVAQVCKQSLIGFLYSSGEIRDDPDMFVKNMDSVEMPRYVLFYTDNTPMSSRTHLAAKNKEAGSAKKPIIFIP